MTISKPTSLEMVLMNSKNIPIFNNMGDGEICALIGTVKTQTIDKDQYVTMEGRSNSYTHIIVYGSFDSTVERKEVEKLGIGDMFGVESVLKKHEGSVSDTTMVGASYKNLLISITINPVHINPSIISSKLYQNMAQYFASKLSTAYKNFNVPK